MSDEITTEFTERMAAPEEADRNAVLRALAGPNVYYVFLLAEISSDGDISLKIEADELLDTGSIKALLRKTLAALP